MSFIVSYIFCTVASVGIVTTLNTTGSITTATTTPANKTGVISVAIVVSVVAICLAFIAIVVTATVVGYLYKKKLHIMLERSLLESEEGDRNQAYLEETEVTEGQRSANLSM